MCGICGLVGFPPGPNRDAKLRAMRDALSHRGPDGEAAWSDAHCALGFRRLAILDLSEAAMQPMANEDGIVRLVLNGEIYNHEELRRELESKGHRFRSRCDAEAALHLYEEMGPECPTRLRGMFALAIWDARDRSLFLARDRYGKKPLLYTAVGTSLAFASEIQALLKLNGWPRDLDEEAVGGYLASGVVPAPRTIFRAIRKLPPGHWLRWRDGRIELKDYRPVHESAAPLKLDEAARCVRESLDESVRARLESDVPVGVLLSGGLDSSIVATLMVRAGVRPLRTFTIGFEEEDFSELEPAGVMARSLGSEHREYIVKPDAASLLPTLVRHFGEPFADDSAIPTFELAKLAARHVKVALSGDGGDEIFGGYRRYRALRLLDLLKRWPAPARWLARRLPIDRRYRARARRLLDHLDEPLEHLYRDMISPIDCSVRCRLWKGPEPPFEALAGADVVHAASRQDFDRYLPDDLLVKTDIASMAHGLEVRCPFLDPAVVELARRIPGDLKIRGRMTKFVLREAFRDLLPPLIVRRGKRGFGVPLDAWLRGPLKSIRDDLLLDRKGRQRGVFDPAVVEELVRQHDAGLDRGRALWALMVFENWHRWVDGGGRAV